MKETIRVYLDNNWHILLLGVLLFPFYCFFLGNAGFLLGFSLSKWHALFAIALDIFSIYLLSADRKSRVYNISFSLLALLFFLILGSVHYDFNWDAISYHKPAAYFLADGWNPVWHQSLPFFCKDHNVSWWWHLSHAQHFPNGQWTINAICYLISGNINLGDFNNIIWAAAVFIVSWKAFTDTWKLPLKWAIPISFVMASNPIVLEEINSGYIDGLLSCTLIVFILSCASWIKTGKKYWQYFIFISVVFGVNLKFTALIYFTLAGIIQSLPILLRFCKFIIKRTDSLQHGAISFKQWFIIILTTSFGVVLTGMHPYGTNAYHYSSPFYFIHSFNSQKYPTLDILPLSDGYEQTNKFQRFWQTYINGVEGARNNYSIPVSDISIYHSNDMMFGKIWIISFLLSVPIAILFIDDCDDFLLLLAILTTVLIQPHLWWARFVPQFWYFPFIIFSIVLSSNRCDFIHHRIAWISIILLFTIIPMNLYDIVLYSSRPVIAIQNERNFIEYVNAHSDGYVIAAFPEVKANKYTNIRPPLNFFGYFSERWLQEISFKKHSFLWYADFQFAEKALITDTKDNQLRLVGISLFYCSSKAQKSFKTLEELQEPSKNQNAIDNLVWLIKTRIHQIYNAWTTKSMFIPTCKQTVDMSSP